MSEKLIKILYPNMKCCTSVFQFMSSGDKNCERRESVIFSPPPPPCEPTELTCDVAPPMLPSPPPPPPETMIIEPLSRLS